MKLLQIELTLYKPLMHNGVKHILVEDMPNTTVIAGENGSGKSSLLRECTPYPACRTDYEKNGSKRVVYLHNGILFTLTSDFSKTTCPHSFVKNGVELNESGTTEVQEELVEASFGLTDVIRKLMSGSYKICSMGRPERKSLILATYPSSLSFLLEKYKSVYARLRTAQGNIKMLSQREQTIKTAMMSTDVLAMHKHMKRDLDKGLLAVDTDIYTIKKSIENISDIIRKKEKELEQIDMTGIDKSTPPEEWPAIQTILSELKSLVAQDIPLGEDKTLDKRIGSLATREQLLEQSIQVRTNMAESLRDDMTRYQECLSKNNQENIDECKRLIEVQNTIIQNTVVDPAYPVLTETEYASLEQSMRSLLDGMNDLRSLARTFISNQEMTDLEMEFQKCQSEISSLETLIQDTEQDLANVTARRDRQAKYTWPDTCTENCMLRRSMVSILTDLNAQIDQLTSQIVSSKEKLAATESARERLRTRLEEGRLTRPLISRLETYFTRVSWGDFVLNNVSFVEAMNQNPTAIHNRILRLQENAKNALQVKDAKEMKQVLEAKLSNLENSSAPAEQLIRENLVKAEMNLNNTIRDLDKDKLDLTIIRKETDVRKRQKAISGLMENVVRAYSVLRQVYYIRKEIEFYQTVVIPDLSEKRIALQNKIMELDTIIKEQDSYLIRLNEEIRPELAKLKAHAEDLAVLEAQLNPNKGIPYLYTAKYINSILTLTNKFISRVWSYPMELQYLDDKNESFDYSFPVILNGNSSIKDISMASAGQQAIINLCFTLAICIFRQYTQDYPLVLDEVTINLSIQHQNNLVLFINELLSQNDQILQILLVDHCIDVCSSFTSIAQMVCLSPDMDVDSEWVRIGVIE